jgi:predicted DNA-binding protein with PD1-like motif
MKTKLLHKEGGLRTYAVVLEIGDEIMSCLGKVARSERLSAAQITAIGAFSEATLLFFDWESREYQPIPVTEQTEVAALIGDIALGREGEPALHVMRFSANATEPPLPGISSKRASGRHWKS